MAQKLYGVTALKSTFVLLSPLAFLFCVKFCTVAKFRKTIVADSMISLKIIIKILGKKVPKYFLNN
jgi:hypothetical protein